MATPIFSLAIALPFLTSGLNDIYREKVFTHIYRSNMWESTESRSGLGSDLEQTEVIRKKLPNIFRSFNIKTMLDIPCGDFFWMQHIDYMSSLEQYIGADIVPDIVKYNTKQYPSDNRTFIKKDIVCDKLPQVDLILCRDCFSHLGNWEVMRALKNIRQSGSKYLLATTYTHNHKNQDFKAGSYRPLNLQRPPFNFPEPLVLINEECTHSNGVIKDKSLGLWRVADLPKHEVASFLVRRSDVNVTLTVQS